MQSYLHLEIKNRTLRSNTVLSRYNLNYVPFIYSQILHHLWILFTLRVHQSTSCVILLPDNSIASVLYVVLYLHNKVASVSLFFICNRVHTHTHTYRDVCVYVYLIIYINIASFTFLINDRFILVKR